MDILKRDFYNRDTLKVARELLGKILVHRVNNQIRSGKIVETEAYLGSEDKASHAYGNKKTTRNAVMFGDCGVSYVFLIYGMYSCFNIVTESEGRPTAVLIRALEPVSGVEGMCQSRYHLSLTDITKKQKINLTNGPGKLCQALSITRESNGIDLCGNNLFICEQNESGIDAPFEIETSERVNIDYAEEYVHMPWRFYIKNNPYVSKP